MKKNYLYRYTLCVVIIITFSCLTKAQTLGSAKNKYLYIGINNTQFNSFATFGKQRNLNWCWAACVQMVLNFDQIPITQEEIVKKAFGKLANRPADANIMFKALNGIKINANGKSVRVNSNNYPTSAKEIKTFLSTKKPLIVGLQLQQGTIGHAYVLIGMYYQQEGFIESDEPHSVILIDPWPGNKSTTDMSWAEFKSKLIVSYKIWIN